MMILDFGSFIINESSLKKLKREVHGVLNMSARKRMRKELRDNIITFKFVKRNGEIRTAHGTLHPSYLPKLKGGSPRPERQMVYYDLDKEGWRSFRSFKFIKILNIKPVKDELIGPKYKTAKASEEDDEELKKKHLHTEKEEEVKKKPEHEEEEVKEVEEEPKKKVKEEEEEPESILDDKDTPEEEEVIKKDNEEEEDDEDKKKKSEDE